jgi:hypothetical protein
MRVLVRRILKKWGYPPDFADDAVKLVLEQAEKIFRGNSDQTTRGGLLNRCR